MTDQLPQQARQNCLAQEREAIAARVAAFKATQEKFAREREAFFTKTLENAQKVDRPSFWP